MIKLIAIVSCLVFSIEYNRSFGQDELLANRIIQTKKDTKIFDLQSLEGKTIKVKVIPDYVNNILRIRFLNDTINIHDYWDVLPTISYLNKKFLQIKYEVRGGTDFALGNTLLVCVSGSKLYEALHILRYTDAKTGNLTKKYNVSLSLYIYKKNYVLKGVINDKVISQDEPETNYNFKNRTNLEFDNKLNVFYSIKDDINDTLNVSYPTGLTYKREIQGTYPTVLLGKEKYVFIGGQWFELYNSTLTKY